jgi:hypothetical protein
MFLRNVGEFLSDCTASHPRRRFHNNRRANFKSQIASWQTTAAYIHFAVLSVSWVTDKDKAFVIILLTFIRRNSLLPVLFVQRFNSRHYPPIRGVSFVRQLKTMYSIQFASGNKVAHYYGYPFPITAEYMFHGQWILEAPVYLVH